MDDNMLKIGYLEELLIGAQPVNRQQICQKKKKRGTWPSHATADCL